MIQWLRLYAPNARGTGSILGWGTTLLRLSMAKMNISLGKCHIALENMWFIFKYLLIFISNIIPQ